MLEGLPVFTTWPVGESLPEVSSIRKQTIVSLPWLAASRKVPEGSSAKKRGVLPCDDSHATGVSTPVVSSTVKVAMLSWPRFDA